MKANEQICARCGITIDKSTGWAYNEEDDNLYCTACSDELQCKGHRNDEPDYPDEEPERFTQEDLI